MTSNKKITIAVVSIAALLIGIFMVLMPEKKELSESFFISKDNCSYCEKRLEDINDLDLKDYAYKKDKAKLISIIGYENYENLSNDRMPILVTEKHDGTFEFKADEDLPKGHTYRGR